MVTVKPLEDEKFLPKCAAEQLACPRFCSQGIEIPIYCFGTKSLMDNSLYGLPPQTSEEEQSLLDSLLLAQWEDRMWKGHFSYDVTTSEIKVLNGRKRFLVQFNSERSVDHEQKRYQQRHLLWYDWTKQPDELLFCITSGDKAYSELIPSAPMPNVSISIFINVNPIEYGHVFMVPHDFNSLYEVLDARCLEMAARVAVEVNNSSFSLFYDCSGPITSSVYFQACYFPELLPVEFMPVDALFSDVLGRIHISVVADYPIKTLLFESTCNFKMMVGVVAEICSGLLDRSIPYNLLISNCGKKIFLFLQLQTLSNSCSLSTWECGGYFLFRSRQEFDQVTEAVLLERLSSVSLDDESFAVVKQFCCDAANKCMA